MQRSFETNMYFPHHLLHYDNNDIVDDNVHGNNETRRNIHENTYYMEIRRT